MNKKRVLSFIFAICFALCLSVPAAMADPTAIAGASAGASAGSTAIGSGGIVNTGPISLGVGTEINSTGSRIPLQPAGIPVGPVISNFGPVHKVWNVISQDELKLLLKLSPEGWTMEQAKSLVARGAKSYSRKIICSLPATDRIQVFYVPPVQVQSEQKEYNEKIDKFIEESGLVKVGIISCRGDEKNDSYDVLGLAMSDTGEVGGKVLILTCLDGQLRTESDGWGIGIGGLQSTSSSGDGRLGTAGYGGTGYSQAGNEYVGKPFARGFACIAKSELKAMKDMPSAVERKAPMGMYYDEYGNIQFERAYGAGIIKNGQ